MAAGASVPLESDIAPLIDSETIILIHDGTLGLLEPELHQN